MKKIALVAIFFVFIISLGHLGCAARFARTENVARSQVITPQDIKIYVNELPDRPYKVIGILEVHPFANSMSSVFKSMRKRAAKEGADAVIHIRSDREYVVDFDWKNKDLNVNHYDTYYGDAIVFTGEKEETNPTTSKP